MTYGDRPGTYGDRPIGVTEPPMTGPVMDYHDRVRWGPIIGGIVVALAAQLILSALGVAVGGGAYTPGQAQEVGTGIGIWSVVSLLISLFLGSWVMARTCGPMNNRTAMLNGAILWATTLALGSWLLTTGLTGTFGLVANVGANVLGPNATLQPQTTTPTITEQEAAQIANAISTASWWFILGSLLGLAASLIGAVVGTRARTRPYAYDADRR